MTLDVGQYFYRVHETIKSVKDLRIRWSFDIYGQSPGLDENLKCSRSSSIICISF